MKVFAVRVPDAMHAAVSAKAAAELRTVSVILRKLLTLWLAGKITLTDD